MPRPANPLVLHTLLGIACLILVSFLLPPGTDLWRRIFAGIFSISLGYQIAGSINAAKKGRAAMVKAWLECLAFPMLIFAFLLLPAANGWLLLITGVAWRPMVAHLWK